MLSEHELMLLNKVARGRPANAFIELAEQTKEALERQGNFGDMRPDVIAFLSVLYALAVTQDGASAVDVSPKPAKV